MRRRYDPTDLRLLLGEMPKKSPMPTDMLSMQIYQYYETDTTIILNPATDDIKYKKAPLISKEMLFLNKSPNKNKPVLIPVCEHLGLLGTSLFRRKHWITLHYNPVNNTATLIDSRPWYISFFYWKYPMWKQLKKGIEQVYGAEQANTLIKKTCYQGVQDEDISCGAHTFVNIQALAIEGGSIDDIRNGTGEDIDSIGEDYEGLINKNRQEHQRIVAQRDQLTESMSTLKDLLGVTNTSFQSTSLTEEDESEESSATEEHSNDDTDIIEDFTDLKEEEKPSL